MKNIIIFLITLLSFSCNNKPQSDFHKENKIKVFPTSNIKNDIFNEFDREKFPLVQKGIEFNLEGKFHESIKQFDEAEKEYGEMTHIFLNRGSAYSSINEIKKAESEYSKCIDFNPKHVPPLINRGLIYIHSGRIDKGINDFNKAIELRPDKPLAYFNRAIAFQKKDNKDLACKDLHKAISLGFDEKYDSIVSKRVFKKLNCEK